MQAMGRRAIEAQPNVTPMIDVMLVLLIIFMTVGPRLEAGFPLTPPTGENLAKHPDSDRDAVIGLDASGGLYFNKRPVSDAELRARLRDRFAARPEDRLVYIRADRGLAFERVRSVMGLASAEGARVVGLVATAAPRVH